MSSARSPGAVRRRIAAGEQPAPKRDPLVGHQCTVCISMSLLDLELLDDRAAAMNIERSTLIRRLIRDGSLPGTVTVKSA